MFNSTYYILMVFKIKFLDAAKTLKDLKLSTIAPALEKLGIFENKNHLEGAARKPLKFILFQYYGF